MTFPSTARFAIVFGVSWMLAAVSWASEKVLGNATEFKSPNGLNERCIEIERIPGGHFHKKDAEQEAAYCGIDFYASTVALCPKTWSTSPGMMVYDVSSGEYENNREGFERKACREGKSASRHAEDVLAKYKTTMNAKGTSGTFAPSSLLYYHFSRYFDMTVKVPVAVWRSMDATEHHEEVVTAGMVLSSGKHGGRMNHAGWQMYANAVQNPKAYHPTDDLFTADRKQVYGVLVSSPGHRYGSEINGTRKSGWGKGQNLDFQETPAFLALRSDKPLKQAIAHGLKTGRKDKRINKDLGPDVSEQQMVFWMKELTEIVLLDFIFSQQDRVGNIDFIPHYYWVEDAKLKHKKANHHKPGDDTVPESAILLHRTNLNDNDAGGRVAYANYTKSTKMLEKLRHMNGQTYQRLMALDADFKSDGPVARWLETSLGLAEAEIKQTRKNTALAADILRSSCEAGNLLFDLDPEAFFVTGSSSAKDIACD